MLCVYVELPYERQIIRISPAELENFYTDVNTSAKHNGASILRSSVFSLYCFDSRSIGFVFSAMRFIYFLLDSLKRQGDRLSECRIIVDVVDVSLSREEIIDHFYTFEKLLIPESDCFATKDAQEVLKAYIRFTPEIDLDLYKCESFILDDEKKALESPQHIITVSSDLSYVWSIYNFMVRHELPDSTIKLLTKEEQSCYHEIKNSIVFFRMHRFMEDLPQCIIDSFLLYAGLYFKRYELHHDLSHAVAIGVNDIEDKELCAEAEKILLVSPRSVITEFSTEGSALSSIPTDLAELIFITIVASHYIFSDEMERFFIFLKKDEVFLDLLYERMHSFGITHIFKDVYSIPKNISRQLKRMVGSRLEKINVHFAEFLWSEYKEARLYADTNLLNVFNALEFKIDDYFLLHSFLHEHTDSLIATKDLEVFKTKRFYSSLKIYQEAILFALKDSLKDAMASAKRAISELQNAHFVTGEYRSFSLLGFLNLLQNKTEDAGVYFGYALDNANSLSDSSFMCESLFHISVTYFLQNRLSFVSTFLLKLSKAVEDSFDQQWKIPCLFMQGRVSLELGEYIKAQKIFQEAADFASLYFEDWEPLCRVWCARALSFSGQSITAKKIFLENIDKTSDAALFFLEAQLFNPIIKDEISDLEINFDKWNIDTLGVKLPSEKNTSTAFSFAEDMVWAGVYETSTCIKVYTIFYNYYTFRLELLKGSASELQERVLKELEDSARQALTLHDPFASIYLYLCYDVFLRLKGANAPETTTYLSKAFKAMQQNVLNINENKIREKIMQENAWNAKLYRAAQEHKLI